MKALAAAADEGSVSRPSAGDKASRALLDYLEAFVSDEFLPDVYVDFRRAPKLYAQDCHTSCTYISITLVSK